MRSEEIEKEERVKKASEERGNEDWPLEIRGVTSGH